MVQTAVQQSCHDAVITQPTSYYSVDLMETETSLSDEDGAWSL